MQLDSSMKLVRLRRGLSLHGRKNVDVFRSIPLLEWDS
jgi:hypothetical protein